jgi:phospholipid/cholesterol/gamma-HCH transport system permease protein
MTAKRTNKAVASLKAQRKGEEEVVLVFEGRLDARSTGDLWRQAMAELKGHTPNRLVIEAQGVDYCDGSGAGLLFALRLRGKREGFTVEIRSLKEEFKQLLDMFDTEDFSIDKGRGHRSINFAEQVGQTTVKLGIDIRQQIIFVGQLCVAMVRVVLHPQQLRWKDAFWAIEQAGANAVGIILLIGFLFGLILAFSSAMSLQQFGVEVYIADLVAMALVRVLGPVITAIILAGRTGSAFAAELGTMKINDEIDALTTMGFEPVSFLVLPRVLATIVITPMLAILMSLSGLVGAGIVMLTLGFPVVTYTNHVQSAIDSGDVYAGLVKAVVFGGLVGGIGCLRGLQTQIGASAVGISTTRAVVSGIVLIIIAEGIFAVLYHYLGI